MAPTWRQRRQAKKTQNMMGGENLYKPSFAEQRRQQKSDAFVNADWAGFDAADASKKGGIDPDAPGTPGQPGFEPQASASDLDDSSGSAVNPLIDPNKSGIPTVEAAASLNKSTGKTYTAGSSGDTSEDFAKEVNELNPTAETSKFPLTKFINMGDKKTDPADFPSYNYHGGGAYSLKDDGNQSRQNKDMKIQVDNFNNPQHDIISSTGTDVPEIAPGVQDVPNINTGDDEIGRIEPKGPAKIDTDTKPREIQTLASSSGSSSSTMPELDTGPGTYQGEQQAIKNAAALSIASALGVGEDSDVSTDLTKNASTATTGDDSAGGSDDKKTKKKKSKGLIGKTTDVASTKSSNISAGSGGAGSTTGYSTRGLGNQNWQLG